MCFHTCTTFSCGHESLNTAPCNFPPTVRPRNFTDHTSDIILIVMDIVCYDCQRSQLYPVQEEETADIEEANDSVEAYMRHSCPDTDTPTGSDYGNSINDTDTLYGSGYDSDRDSDSDYNPDGSSAPAPDSGEEFDSGSDSGSDSDSGTYVLEYYSDDAGSMLYLTFV